MSIELYKGHFRVGNSNFPYRIVIKGRNSEAEEMRNWIQENIEDRIFYERWSAEEEKMQFSFSNENEAVKFYLRFT